MYIMPFDTRIVARQPLKKGLKTQVGGEVKSVRETVIGAACEAFANEGYSATTIQSIARLAGIPKSNVLYYFKSKENIYAQVLEDIASAYLNAYTPFDADEEPFAAMTTKVRVLLELFQQRPLASKVLMVELRQDAPRLPNAYFEQWTTQAQQSVTCLRRWIDRGLLAPVDPYHLLLTMGAMAQSCISLGWQLPGNLSQSVADRFDFEAAASTTTRLLLRGLMPDRVLD